MKDFATKAQKLKAQFFLGVPKNVTNTKWTQNPHHV